MELSGLDIKVIVSEISSSLIGYYVNNVYSLGDDRILIRLHHSEKAERRLVLSAKGIWLTKYELPFQESTKLVKALRENLLRAKLVEVFQPATERVVILSLEGREGTWKLVGEFFGKGNIILLDSRKGGKIVAILNSLRTRDRDLVVGAEYSLPRERGRDPFAVTMDDIAKITSSELNVSKWMVTNISLPRKYVDEILVRAKVLEGKLGKDLSQVEVDSLSTALQEVLKLAIEARSPTVFYQDGEVLDVTPFPFEHYKGLRPQNAPSFIDALDEVRSKEILTESSDEGLKPLTSKCEELEKSIESQKRMILKLKEKESSMRSIADRLSSSPDLGLPSALQILKEATGAEIREEKGTIRFRVFDEDVYMGFGSSTMKLASELYNISKVFRSKLPHAEDALRSMEEELSRVRAKLEKKEILVSATKRKTLREKMWFERYRWFSTSDGLLALGGRDVSSNSTLIRKHMKSMDLVFHGDLHGSPFFLLKEGAIRDFPSSIGEVAEAVASFSKAWKDQFASADSYWVRPDQVKSQAPSGMYLPKGSFLITGKKNYVKGLELKMAVGILEKNGSYMLSCGPVSAMKKNSLAYVEIVPWRGSVADTAKNVVRELSSMDYSEAFKAIGLDEVVRCLPGGAKVTAKRKGEPSSEEI